LTMLTVTFAIEIAEESVLKSSPYAVTEVTTCLVWFNRKNSYQSSVFSYQKNCFVLTDN